jgi:sigma-E factor negative regulatory protein RseA
MNETERDSQLSALFDGELEADPAALVTRRLLKDPALRATWGRYALIGAVLRQEPLLQPAGGRADLADRVRQSLLAEPALAPVAQTQVFAPQRASSWRRALTGVALAASVATVAVLAMRWQTPAATAPLAAQPSEFSPVVAANVTPPQSSRVQSEPPVSTSVAGTAHSYTTPRQAQSGSAHLAAPLFNYVVAHSDYASPGVRLSSLSAQMSGSIDPAENTVPMTKDEVGARH